MSNTRKITIGGLELNAPTPYAEGHVLTSGEAAALNQTYLENLGNNFRATIDAEKRNILAGPDATAEAIKAVSADALKNFLNDDAQVAALAAKGPVLQTEFDKLVAEYKMGVRRTSTVEVVDPVTKEARAQAWELIKAKLNEKGIKINSVGADKKAELIASVLEKRPEVTEAAKRTVKMRKQLAEGALSSLDDLEFGSGAPAEAEATPAV